MIELVDNELLNEQLNWGEEAVEVEEERDEDSR